MTPMYYLLFNSTFKTSVIWNEKHDVQPSDVYRYSHRICFELFQYSSETSNCSFNFYTYKVPLNLTATMPLTQITEVLSIPKSPLYAINSAEGKALEVQIRSVPRRQMIFVSNSQPIERFLVFSKKSLGVRIQVVSVTKTPRRRVLVMSQNMPLRKWKQVLPTYWPPSSRVHVV